MNPFAEKEYSDYTIRISKLSEEQITELSQEAEIELQEIEEEKTMTRDLDSAENLLFAKLIKEATELLSQQIQKQYIIYTTRDDERSECWIYEEGIFKPEGKTYIKEYTRQHTKEFYTPDLVNKVIAKVEADTYIEQDDFFNRQNKYSNLIPVI